MDTKPTIKNFIIIILPALLVIFIIFFLVMPKVKENRANNETQVTNFEECIEAGNPAMESYPRQCRHGDRTFTENIEELPSANGKLKAIDCLPEQRNADECIEIYQPVCGQMQVECITAPCDPVKVTFENSCKACANPRVISYLEGECFEDNEVKY